MSIYQVLSSTLRTNHTLLRFIVTTPRPHFTPVKTEVLGGTLQNLRSRRWKTQDMSPG